MQLLAILIDKTFGYSLRSYAVEGRNTSVSECVQAWHAP